MMYLYGENIVEVIMDGRWIHFVSDEDCVGSVKYYFDDEERIGEQIRIIDYCSDYFDEEELDEDEIDKKYQDLKDEVYDNEYKFVKVIEKRIEMDNWNRIVSNDLKTFYTVEDDGSLKFFLKVEDEYN